MLSSHRKSVILDPLIDLPSKIVFTIGYFDDDLLQTNQEMYNSINAVDLYLQDPANYKDKDNITFYGEPFHPVVCPTVMDSNFNLMIGVNFSFVVGKYHEKTILFHFGSDEMTKSALKKHPNEWTSRMRSAVKYHEGKLEDAESLLEYTVQTFPHFLGVKAVKSVKVVINKMKLMKHFRAADALKFGKNHH